MHCDRMQGKDLAAGDSSTLVHKHVLRNDRRVANLEIVLRFSPCRSRQAFAWQTRSARKAGASDGQADTASPAAGQARVSSPTTAEWAAPVRSAASAMPMAERSGPHAALLSPEFWLHQPLAPAGICDRRFYTVWRSRLFHASAAAPAWLFASTAAGIRDRLLRWLLRGVRPGDVHNPELRGSAGLIRGFGRCAHALLGELCAALDSAMLMTSQWAAK